MRTGSSLRLRGTLVKPEALATNRMEGIIGPGKRMSTDFDLERSSCIQLPVDTVFCLPLIRSRGALYGFRGLLLKACDDEANRGRFERAGYFADWDPDLSFFGPNLETQLGLSENLRNCKGEEHHVLDSHAPSVVCLPTTWMAYHRCIH